MTHCQTNFIKFFVYALLCSCISANANYAQAEAPERAITSGTTGTSSSSPGSSKGEVLLEEFCRNLDTPGGDVSECLQEAIEEAGHRGRCLNIPAIPNGVGYWTVTKPILIGNGSTRSASTLNDVCIHGAGSGGLFGSYGSYLRWSGSANGPMLSILGEINNITLEGLNLNGSDQTKTVIFATALRFSRFRDLYISGFTEHGIDLQGKPRQGGLNFMLDWSFLYVTTSQSNAQALRIDGVLSAAADTWLSTIRNSRFECLGAIRCTAVFLGFSDNILWEQTHVSVKPGNCGLTFSAMTSGSGGNSYPTGHLFLKSAIGGETCTIEDELHTIGVNNFIDFGTTDNEPIPRHPKLRGITDQGSAFNGWGRPSLHTPNSSSAPCNPGQFIFDAEFIYTCVSRDKWRRTHTDSF